MTVTINGTTGVSGVAGSASTPALIGSDADSGYYINSANEPNASVNGTAVWSAASTFGFKNRIINGNMVIDQRNAGASVNTNQAYPVDRFKQAMSGGGVLTSQQSSTVPSTVYFPKSMSITVSTADASIAAADYYILVQQIEGYNTADLGWGTSSASAVTVSFWVRSSVTGTFSGGLENNAGNRGYVFTYTINAANTWEYKTITIPGDTTGTWETTSAQGIQLAFDLGTGTDRCITTANTWGAQRGIGLQSATKLISTLNATFYITGVQLEKGSTATSFDFRPYTTELQLCYRYYWKYVSGNSSALCVAAQYDAGTIYGVITLPVTMRSAPTTACSTGSGYYNFVRAGASDLFNSITVNSYTSNSSVEFYNNTEISGTAGQAGWIRTGDANSFIAFTAEL